MATGFGGSGDNIVNRTSGNGCGFGEGRSDPYCGGGWNNALSGDPTETLRAALIFPTWIGRAAQHAPALGDASGADNL